MKPVRTPTRWVDAVSASAQPSPDGIALSFYEASSKNRDTSRPSTVVFLTRRQIAGLCKQIAGLRKKKSPA